MYETVCRPPSRPVQLIAIYNQWLLMAHLFDSLKLRGVQFANRIAVSPMCQYSCKEGFATDWHFVHLGSRAVGRAAAVIAEATAITADSRISPQDLGLWKDAHIEPLRRVFSFVTGQGAVPGIQLAHAGRKASTNEPWNGGKPISPAEGGWTPIFAPSALAFAEGYQVPQALTIAEIGVIIEAFAAAARRAQIAGAKLIELQSAHGYLLHSVLPALSHHLTHQ